MSQSQQPTLSPRTTPSPQLQPDRTPLRPTSRSPAPALSPSLSPTVAHFPSSTTRSPVHSRSPSASSAIRPPILIPSSPHPPPPPPSTVLATELGLTPGISPPRARSRPPSMYVGPSGAGTGMKSGPSSHDNLLDFFSASTAQPGGHLHGSGSATTNASVSPARSRRTSRVGAKHAHSTSGGRLPSPPPSGSAGSTSPGLGVRPAQRLSQPTSSRPTSFFLARSASPDPTSVLDPTTIEGESFDIFERDVLHTNVINVNLNATPSHVARMTAHEAVDVAIPPVLDEAAEAVAMGDSRVDEEVRGIIGAFGEASVGVGAAGAKSDAAGTGSGALAMNMGASTSSKDGLGQPSIGAWLQGQNSADESDSDGGGVGGGGGGVGQWGLTEMGMRRYYAPAPASSASPPGSVLSFPLSSPSPTSSPTSPRSLSPAPMQGRGTASPIIGAGGGGLKVLDGFAGGAVGKTDGKDGKEGREGKDEGRRLSFVSLADIINSERTPMLGSTSPHPTRHASPAISTASYGPWEFADEEHDHARGGEGKSEEEEVLDADEEDDDDDDEGEQFATLKARASKTRRRLPVEGVEMGLGTGVGH